MSESLSLELAGTGVCVTAVCPGFTFSEFHDVNGTRKRVSAPAERDVDGRDTVARQGIEAALEGRVVLVNGTVNKLIASAMKHLPEPIARGIVQRQAQELPQHRLICGSLGLWPKLASQHWGIFEPRSRLR